MNNIGTMSITTSTTPALLQAQALTREFRIRGIETYTETLRESAGALCASFDALRVVFRSEAMRNPQPPYAECIVSVVRDFDRAWVRAKRSSRARRLSKEVHTVTS